MQIVDAQIHLWGTGLPSNLSHRQVTSFTAEEAIALMGEGGVDAAVIHPPGWDPGSTDMAFRAVRDYPGRFAIKAVEVCGKRQTCLVYGWDKAERVPVAVTEARPAGVLFAYSHRGDEQKAMWDCTRIKRDKPDQCLPGTIARVDPPVAA